VQRAKVVSEAAEKIQSVVLYVGDLLSGFASVLEAHSALVTAAATAVIAWYTWALRNSTNRLWEAGERQFELEGPFLQPVILYATISHDLRSFILFRPSEQPGFARNAKGGLQDQERWPESGLANLHRRPDEPLDRDGGAPMRRSSRAI